MEQPHSLMQLCSETIGKHLSAEVIRSYSSDVISNHIDDNMLVMVCLTIGPYIVYIKLLIIVSTSLSYNPILYEGEFATNQSLVTLRLIDN